MTSMTSTKATLAMVLAASAATSATSAQPIYETDFNNAAQAADFATDRANPGGFTVNDSGNGVLQIESVPTDAPGQTSSFYNFHGIQTGPAGDFNAGPGALVTVDLFVPSSWNDPSVTRAGDLWARIDDPATSIGQDLYPSVGVYNVGDGRGALASLFSPTFNSFDSAPGAVILDLPGVAINFDAFNTLGLRFTGTSVEYLFNGAVFATESDAIYSTAIDLDQAYLQTFQATDAYTATFDNLIVTPTPASAALLGMAGLAATRRRRA